MPRKGMLSLLFSSKTASSSASQRPTISRAGPSTSDLLTERSLGAAEAMIMKWNPDNSTFARVTSLFYENRGEAVEFIKCVNDLQKAMQSFVVEIWNSEKLVRGQTLMVIAMKRLEKEFYQILSMNRAHLDPESVSARSSLSSTRSSTSVYENDEDDNRISGESISNVERESAAAMADLRSIAECMIFCGYGRECVKIYKIMRKSIVDEGIYRLGVERVSSSNIQKMDWEVLGLRIKNWLNAVKIALNTLFSGERILCDHVFAASESIRESCFAEITKEGAQILFGFPESVAKSKKKSPEKVFRTLDMYTAIANNWPEIESIFSLESTSVVRSQAVNSRIKLGESVRTMLADFESAILKEASKSVPAGGAVHPQTEEVMNYLPLLSDYSNILVDILAGSPTPPKSALPESYFKATDSDESPASAVSLRFAWLILALLCKLDGKAKHYKDVSLSYLFLANNLQHILNRVRTSNIKYLLGNDWLSKQELKVMQFAANYERLGWDHVIKSLPENPTAAMRPAEAKEFFRRFNEAFELAYRKQSACIVPDSKLRDEIKVSIAGKLATPYREFYSRHFSVMRGERNLNLFIRFAPDDVENYLSDLYFGNVWSGSFLSSLSSSTRSRPSRPR